MKKFELTTEAQISFGKTLYRIKALISFGEVCAGDIGGWVEKEENLSHDGDAWVFGDALVFGNARVSGNARVMWISNIGSRNGTTTFFATKTGIYVNCGCFSGSLEAFAAAVDKNHGDSEHGKAYRLAIEIAKLRIKLPEEESQ